MSPTVMPCKLDKRGARHCVSATSSAAGCNTVTTSVVMPISRSSFLEALPDVIGVRTRYPLTRRCLANSVALYSIPHGMTTAKKSNTVSQPHCRFQHQGIDMRELHPAGTVVLVGTGSSRARCIGHDVARDPHGALMGVQRMACAMIGSDSMAAGDAWHCTSAGAPRDIQAHLHGAHQRGGF